MTKQAIGQLVTDLEELGHVERIPDSEDGRAKIVRLTPQAWNAIRVAEGIIQEIEREWTGLLGQEAKRNLRHGLEILVRHYMAETTRF